jgi:hypothetical protein
VPKEWRPTPERVVDDGEGPDLEERGFVEDEELLRGPADKEE